MIISFMDNQINRNLSKSNIVHCANCNAQIHHLNGLKFIKCNICRHINLIQQVQVQCPSCYTYLVVPITAQLALCPKCKMVMNIKTNNEFNLDKDIFLIDIPTGQSLDTSENIDQCIAFEIKQ